jgi:hypothetical protein
MITNFLQPKNPKSKGKTNSGKQENSYNSFFNQNKSASKKVNQKNPFDQYKPWIEK